MNLNTSWAKGSNWALDANDSFGGIATSGQADFRGDYRQSKE
jgi:hypothetical protein